ncbi:MAG TPA: MBOAT family protein [Acidimicrobiia bacterium]|nr:MBOAT family protein [Acidimicrobiia bacterium]
MADPVIFPTIEFALFFAVVLTVSWLLLPHPRRWKLFILAASYFFYGSWDWRFCFLLAFTTVADHTIGGLIHRRSDPIVRKRLLIIGLIVSLGVLGYFKYYDFFASSLINLLAPVGIDVPLPILNIILPVGISFFTFQSLSYTIDIYRGKLEPVPLLDFAAFVSFFPHLVAGPIVRSAEFLPQLRERHDPRRVAAGAGFLLIAGGLFKKVVVANTLATTLVDPVFASPASFSSLETLAGIYGYAVQIYADFSGYTDIAIGLALLLGFRFPQNFNRPYIADSLQDFWRRWHMTLSRFLRDYLYIPLGGSRKGTAATYRNLMITMLLGGLWHGAAWTFVLWGGLHGAVLALERWNESRREARGAERVDTLGRRVFRRVIIFHVVCLGWVLFRSDSLATALTVLGRLGSFGPVAAITPAVVILIVGGLGAQYLPSDLRLRLRRAFVSLQPVPMAAALGAFLLVLDALGPEGVAPFIYFQF